MSDTDAAGRYVPGTELPEAHVEPAPSGLATSPAEPVPGPGFWGALGWTVLLFFAVQAFGVMLVLGLLVVGVSPEDTIWAMFVASTATISLASTGLSIGLFGPAVLRRLAVTRPTNWHVLLTVLLVGPLAAVVQEIAAWAGEILPTFSGEYYKAFAEMPWALVVLLGCVLPAFGEELFFRGLLGRGLVARLGVVGGTLWGSFLFAVIHLDPAQVVGVLFIGIALQLVMLASRSILVPMLLHFSNNLLSFAQMKSGVFMEADHLPWPIVFSGCLAVAPLAALFWQTRTQWGLPGGERWTPGYVTAEAPPAEFGARLQARRPSIILLALAVAAQAAFWASCVQNVQ